MFELKPECKERCPVFVAIRVLEDVLSSEDRLRLEEAAAEKMSQKECPTSALGNTFACKHPDNQDDQIGSQVMDLAEVYIEPGLRQTRADSAKADVADLFTTE